MGNKRSKTEEALKLLKGAYQIQTPEDSRTYYKDFSKHYDETFVKQLAYIYPKRVAEELLAHFDGDGTICDIGCGTGLAGQELRYLNANVVIDGVDISREMIAVAKTKNVYRNFYEIDLTKPILGVPTDYAALISSGTFTHGHLGPEILVSLLSLCRDNALLTVGVNESHYRDKGFEKALNEMQDASRIKMIKVSKQTIYSSQNATDLEGNSTALICTFTKDGISNKIQE
tara:strand:+ start:338 stop:1027 length:690 start_codon:yes stop_codon:yes gene_type:complete